MNSIRLILLKKIYVELVEKYTNNEALKQELWNEIEFNYSHNNRHYHTLNHLQQVYSQLVTVKENIEDWQTCLFSLFYHDIVYHPEKRTNEIKSALLAEKRMKLLFISNHKIDKCKKQILATKSHEKTSQPDTNYFLDADLSILGQKWTTYSQYLKSIRKEYSIYPNKLYRHGRKKILKNFLKKNRIYNTEFFYLKLENQAKKNIKKELALL